MRCGKLGSAILGTALVCGLGAVMSAGAEKNEKILLQTSFEEGQGPAPAGWMPAGGAQWAEFARTGKRSIEIRSWKTDAEYAQVLDQYQSTVKANNPEVDSLVKVDPKKASWQSGPIELSGQPVKVSFWGANNITYMNDESFRAEVGLAPCRADGTPEDLDATLSGKPLHFYRTERENYQLYARCVPEGLRWEYRELVLKPAKGTYRVVLHFQKEPDGQVWVDDLVVSESPDYRTTQEAVAAQMAATPTLPLEMQINFPVSFNLFVKGDPLQSDLAIIGKDGPPALKEGMTVNYEIRDYNYQWVYGSTFRLGKDAYPIWQPGGDAPKSPAVRRNAPTGMAELEGKTRMVPLDLPASLADYEGRLLFLKASLFDGRNKLAEDEVTFGILAPPVPKTENLWRGGKVVGSWSAHPDLDHDYLDVNRESHGLFYKMGAQWNAIAPDVSFDTTCWSRYNPSKDGPIDFGTPTGKVYPNYGHLLGVYLNMGYRNYNSVVPKWTEDRSPEAIRKYGYWVFDKQAYARYMAALTQRLTHQFPNALAISPTAGEQAFDAWRYELQQAAYPAIKAVNSNAQVGAWFWANDTSTVTGYCGAFDFFDTEMYTDPHLPQGRVGPTVAARCTKELKRPIWSAYTEGCALCGSAEQPEMARGVIDYHLFEWSYGNRFIAQYEFLDPCYALDGSPVRRAPLTSKFGCTGNTSGAKRYKLTRYDTLNTNRVGRLLPYHYQPTLPMMAMANLIRFLDSAQFEREIPMDDAYGLQFERLDTTVLFLETRELADLNVDVGGLSNACETLDIFGYRHHLDPLNGHLLLTIGHYPLILLFDKHLAKDVITVTPVNDVKIAMSRPIVKESPGEVTVNLGKERTGKLVMVLDSKLKAPASVGAKAGEDARIAITPQEERPTGRYRMYVKVMNGGKTSGLLSLPLQFQSSGIRTSLAGLPMTRALEPGVEVTLHNATGKASDVAVHFLDAFTATNDRPVELTRTVTLPVSGTATVDFPLNRDRVKLNLDYPLTVTLDLPGGVHQDVSETVHFRGVPKMAKPIAIDGDLSDWPLDQLIPVEPDWAMWFAAGGHDGAVARRYTATWERQNNPAGKYRAYLLWNEKGLYFGAVVNNPNRSRPQKNPEDFWAQDCMFLTFYGDTFTMGGASVMRPVKIHLAMDAAGKPCLLDMEGMLRKPEDIGCEYVAKETATGYVYEFLMGPAFLKMMKLEPGSGFSLSLMALPTNRSPIFMKKRPDALPMYVFFRNCVDFDGGVQDMARFILTDK